MQQCYNAAWQPVIPSQITAYTMHVLFTIEVRVQQDAGVKQDARVQQDAHLRRILLQ
jgi:hypothetical protein